ncbi:TlpA family protein disulfide reductase [Streptomyces sp. H27-D2]|uniref:TlpA family protein disulfide reductase n=1 Tax=Streptomyces sp. H27-D2 TaxID=3046304 RepID=UPI002DB81D5C|nr:TlpA disulfide reductase family protein [Streptomyces sp. H27-D2]MEC4017006.1 TlpA disulfide reductase family protein [Streptomyces sp. H27-D2]
MSASRAPRRPVTRRRATVSAVGAAVAALALSACGSGGADGGSSDTKFVSGPGGIDTVAKADRTAAPLLAGEKLGGGRIDLADYRGKIIVLNVWGSWCAPCRAEATNLVKVANETKADGVQFVGINARDPNKAPAVKFEKEFKVPYPSLYDPVSKQMLRFPRGSLNPKAIPSTIVIDRHGKIAARTLTALSEKNLRKMVDPLIAEK